MRTATTNNSKGVMSTPFLNAEKWLRPTVLQYCRRTPQHLNPLSGNLVLYQRMHRSTFTALNVVLLFLALSFLSHQFEQALMTALCYWFQHLSFVSSSSYRMMFRCSRRRDCHFAQCEYRALLCCIRTPW